MNARTSSRTELVGPAAASARAAERRADHGIPRRLRRFTSGVGGFYLTMAGINVGLALGRPHVYDTFADQALLTWVREAWRTVFAAHPAPWAGALALGEVAIGVALLNGGRWAVAGYAGVVAFHLALLLFGWGTWWWAVPVLGVVVPVGLAYARRLRAAEAVA